MAFIITQERGVDRTPMKRVWRVMTYMVPCTLACIYLIISLEVVHEPAAKVVSDDSKAVRRVLQLREEFIRLCDALPLGPPHIENGVVLGRAYGALTFVLSQTPAVKGVHA